MQQAPPEAQAIIGQLAAAWMQQRGQQGRGMVNPMGPSFAGGSAPDTNMLEGGSLMPQPPQKLGVVFSEWNFE